MSGQIENRMVVDSEWKPLEKGMQGSGFPVCGCCEEGIRQEKALHILSGMRKVWICDRCIEDLMEHTGYEGG